MKRSFILGLALENENQQSEAVDAEDTLGSIDEHIDELNELDEVSSALESYQHAIEHISKSCISQEAAEYLELGLESLFEKTGMDFDKSMPSMESFGTDQIKSSTLVLESIGEALNRAWEKIKEILKKIVNWIKGFFDKSKREINGLRSKIKNLESKNNSDWSTVKKKIGRVEYSSSKIRTVLIEDENNLYKIARRTSANVLKLLHIAQETNAQANKIVSKFKSEGYKAFKDVDDTVDLMQDFMNKYRRDGLKQDMALSDTFSLSSDLFPGNKYIQILKGYSAIITHDNNYSDKVFLEPIGLADVTSTLELCSDILNDVEKLNDLLEKSGKDIEETIEAIDRLDVTKEDPELDANKAKEKQRFISFMLKLGTAFISKTAELSIDSVKEILSFIENELKHAKKEDK